MYLYLKSLFKVIISVLDQAYFEPWRTTVVMNII